MKKITILLSLISISLIVFSQRVSQLEEYKCSHGDVHHLKDLKAYNPVMNKYDVKFYFLDVAVTNTSQYISGNTFIKALTTDNLDTFLIQLDDNMIVDSVLFDGVNVSYQHLTDELSVIVSTIPASTYFTVQVYYSGNSSGGGLTSDNWWGWVPFTTWTLSESFHAKEWFPCKEVLSDKADSAYIFITVDNNLMAGSNGLLTAITPIGGSQSRYEWKTYYPINYYLISLSVAPYVDYSFYAHPAGLLDSILVQNYVYDTTANNLTDIDQTADLIELFSDLMGMYPFKDEKYGHCQAPLGGAMEHQTMTTTGYLDFWIIAHELGHQWFGDNVTCATWQDIWVNEGFASYTEYLAEQYLVSQASADAWIVDAHSFADNQPMGSVYIPLADATNENRIFSKDLSYKKGGSIIHSIRFMLNNDTIFFKTLTDFQNMYKDSVATGIDFRDLLLVESGIDFTDFFDQWYFGEGFPTYNVTWSHALDTLTLNVEQTTSSPNTTFFGNDMEYRILMQTGDTIVRVSQSQNTQQYKFNITDIVTDIEVDPNNWILDAPGIILSRTEKKDINKQISIYPNPFNEDINIVLNDEYKRSEISIYDISGRVVYSDTFSGSHFRMNLNYLDKGTYIINVSTNNNSFSKKLFKQ